MTATPAARTPEVAEAVAAVRAMWDDWARVHVDSEFYDVPGFLAGRSTLDRLERSAVGEVVGQRLLHLQCHFGLDTMSWARVGAEVTGVDFSSVAIDAARRLSEQADLDATFVCCDVTDTLDHVEPASFDVVFASWGAIPWLPDLAPWAKVIAGALRRGGRLALVEGHPFMWVFDEKADGELRVGYPYGFGDNRITIPAKGTYAVPDAPIEHVEHSWAHTVAEILGSLLDAGLTIERFEEHEAVAWQALPWMVVDEDGLWRWPDGHPDIPLSITVVATKP